MKLRDQCPRELSVVEPLQKALNDKFSCLVADLGKMNCVSSGGDWPAAVVLVSAAMVIVSAVVVIGQQ